MLERFDFGKRAVAELAGDVDWFEASGDGTRLVISDHGKLTVIPAERKADRDNPDDEIVIDRSRARFLLIRPRCGVRPTPRRSASCGTISGYRTWPTSTGTPCRTITGRCSTGSPLGPNSSTCSGRYSASWAPRMPTPTRRTAARQPPRPACSALTSRDGDAWRVTRVVRGDTSDPGPVHRWRRPAPAIAVGDVLLAVDGQPVGLMGPGRCCRRCGQAGRADRRARRREPPAQRPGRPLRSDTRLRYLDWVSAKRAQVRELSGGQIGYLHVPDMVSNGWADFLRDLRTEMLRDALIVDVRGNAGGHTSQLVVEKLARRVIGWDVPAA